MVWLPKPPDRVLIVCLRRLGDVLLTTPLAVSMQAAWPGVQVDWLVFEGTEGMLASNPAAHQVFTLKHHSGVGSTIRLIKGIVQKYDLALSSQAGDRPSFFALLAGRSAITFRSSARGARLRDRLFSATVVPQGLHRIDQVLALLQPLGIPHKRNVSTPNPDFSFVEAQGLKSYVVLHPGAAFRYKTWTKAGWRYIAEKCLSHGLSIVLTGSDQPSERHYLDETFTGLSVCRADGALSWSQLTGLLVRADGFAGVDTSVTHLATACGVPGVAIFGPTDPQIWGPDVTGSEPRIRIVNSRLPCVPCQQEGCERHILSHSACLDFLPGDSVWSEFITARSGDASTCSRFDPNA